MSPDLEKEVVEALRPRFSAVVREAEKAIQELTTGEWGVLGGHMPRASVSLIRAKDGMTRTINIHFPHNVGGIASMFSQSFDIKHGTLVARVRQALDAFEKSGPGCMAEVIVGCIACVMRAGVTYEGMTAMIGEAAVRDVMEA